MEDQQPHTIQMLVDHWRDERGLCRALCNPGHGLVLSVPHSELVQQHIRLNHCEMSFHMPYFTQEGDVAAQEYVPCALAIHEGTVTQQGHYRSALRTAAHWMVYDDNQIQRKSHP